jgi:AMP nucleosidase
MDAKAVVHQTVGSPEEAVDALASRYHAASVALRDAVERYLAGGEPPTPKERMAFFYPELRITYAPDGLVPTSPRAYAKFSVPGDYTTTVTQPAAFRDYLIEQLAPLMSEFNAKVEVGMSRQEIPYPYVFERGDELGRGGATAADLALHFPIPHLSEVGDEIADGLWDYDEARPRPLSLFDAVRVDFRCVVWCIIRARIGGLCSRGFYSPIIIAMWINLSGGASKP